jgi:spore coat protein U-like protein
MPRTISIITKLFLLATLLVATAVASFGQSTTGTVTMSATVSKFVEINSGGAVTLTGNSGGGVTTDGVANSPLAVSINLGELGPSNTNSFVTAQVPLKLRSNASYVLSMTATVTSSGTTASRIVASDVGFGLGTVSLT